MRACCVWSGATSRSSASSPPWPPRPDEAIFAEAPDRGHADLPDDRLVEYARQVGVADLERFRADMHAPENVDAVKADLIEASALGVPSTPAFVLNGAPILGAQPLEAFSAAIDAAMAAG